MIITIVKDNKLFIQFDSLVKRGSLLITDGKQYTFQQDIIQSEFEVIDLPEKLKKITIQIDWDETRINRTIRIS